MGAGVRFPSADSIRVHKPGFSEKPGYAQIVLNFVAETLMSAPEPTIQSLYDALIVDLMKALALKRTQFANGFIQMMFGRAARRVLKQHLEWQV